MIPSPPCRPACRVPRTGRRLLLILVAPLAAVGLLVATGSPASAAPAPAGVAGDPHSPTVALLAQAALMARDVFVVAGDPASLHAYQGSLAATAQAVAAEFAADPAVVHAAFGAADLQHQTAVLAALSQLGVAYRYATSEPGVGFDCSGLTSWAWGQAGVYLPHQSRQQYGMLPHVPVSAAQPGDLLFFYSPISHVSIYLGGGQQVHAPNSGTTVKTGTVNWSRVVGVGRPG